MTTVPVRRHNHVRRLASDRVFDGVLYTIAAILTLTALYPMYFIIIASISDPSLVAQGKILLLPRGVTLEGYEHLASMKNLWVGYGNTILYTIAGTAIMLVVNIPVAYALSRRDLVGRRWFTLFFVFPMFFGGGLIPTFIIINNWFHLLDTFTVMVLPFSVIAYYIIVARTFFQSSLPAELWDAAQIDGCGNLRYFFHHCAAAFQGDYLRHRPVGGGGALEQLFQRPDLLAHGGSISIAAGDAQHPDQ